MPAQDPSTALPDSSFPARAYDVIVIGAGVAGLAFTLRLPAQLRVALFTKAALGESNTRYAQGGLAAAVGLDDATDFHFEDTIIAGAGLCDPAAVRALVNGAPEAVDWLVQIGTEFDREGATWALGREGAHSRRRVLHAGGDATGAEIERALVAQVRADPHIDVFEHAFVADLLMDDGACRGIVADVGEATPVTMLARLTVLAAGGAGQLWATTSNPEGATADGLAMAMRAGTAIADVEFMQFHPTVLALPETAPFLVSEAVRGEGAYLRDAHGNRFMLDQHEMAELAPRDVVARAIQRQIAADGTDHVSLDLRHLDPADVVDRFPTIAAELSARGLDLAHDLIPIAPAAHYFMGGIVAGTDGRTSVPGLLALGEVSCTGVHGANRLASNSLLEGLVFGLNAADQLARNPLPVTAVADVPTLPRAVPDASRQISWPEAGTIARLRRRLQRAMSRDVSVLRDAEGLRAAATTVADLKRAFAPVDRHAALRDGRTDILELDNMLTAADAIIAAAIFRTESRGAHAREDFPETNPAWDLQHSLWQAGSESGWHRGSLATALPQPSPLY